MSPLFPSLVSKRRFAAPFAAGALFLSLCSRRRPRRRRRRRRRRTAARNFSHECTMRTRGRIFFVVTDTCERRVAGNTKIALEESQSRTKELSTTSPQARRKRGEYFFLPSSRIEETEQAGMTDAPPRSCPVWFCHGGGGREGGKRFPWKEGRKRPPDDKYASAPPHSCFAAARGAGNSGMGLAKPVKSYYAIKILLFWLTV